MISFFKKRNPKRFFLKTALYLCGIMADAFGMAVFLLPMKFIVAGATGMGRVLAFLSHGGLDVNIAVTLVSIFLFLLAFFFMGKRYAMTIIVGTFAFPAFLTFFSQLPCLQQVTDNPLLAMVCGAMSSGIGVAMVIRAGGSTGGADVIPVILHSKKRLPIAPVMYALDCLIMLLQIPFATKEQILLGVLAELVCVVSMDKALGFATGEVQFMIFSKKWQEIRKAILNLDLGATLIQGEGGMTGEEMQIVLCVASTRRMNEIREAIQDVDPVAFFTTSSVREVNGRGFSLSRKYLDLPS